MLKLQYQPVPNFEELLTNDPDTYAQACWSLANHSDETGVELGATITIGGPWKSTVSTVMNIG